MSRGPYSLTVATMVRVSGVDAIRHIHFDRFSRGPLDRGFGFSYQADRRPDPGHDPGIIESSAWLQTA